MLLVFRDSGRWSAAVDGSHVMSQDDDSRQYNLSGTMHLYFGTDELEQGGTCKMSIQIINISESVRDYPHKVS